LETNSNGERENLKRPLERSTESVSEEERNEKVGVGKVPSSWAINERHKVRSEVRKRVANGFFTLVRDWN
jgi:hypothetical protein